jgi:hypothetical protein
MQETAFVCLEEEKVGTYVAMMEASHMKIVSQQIVIPLFPQRLDSILQPASSLPKIENTYPQLP